MSLSALRLARFSARGLARDLRAPDVRALFVALALAVAASTMIGFFLDRLDRGLTRQASQLLGGDLVLEQGRPFDSELRGTLEEAGLVLSDQVDMVSMVSLGDAFQPASLKVVDGRYPLYGGVHVDLGEGVEVVARGPSPGEVWLAPRLALLLEAEIGDRVRLGESELVVAGLVEREPDQSAGFGSFNPRLMMHRDDMEATDLVQDGSRVEFELLAAGPPDILDDLAPLLERLRRDGVEVRDVRRDRPGLGSALERAERYLSLAGLAAVLLAGVAVAMSTRRYVDRHLDTAALLRCFGATQGELTRLFGLQLLWLALAASVLGALLGLAGQARCWRCSRPCCPWSCRPRACCRCGSGCSLPWRCWWASPGRRCCDSRRSAPSRCCAASSTPCRHRPGWWWRWPAASSAGCCGSTPATRHWRWDCCWEAW